MESAGILQNTPEWRAERAGKITGSRMGDVIAYGKAKGEPLEARKKLVADLVAEILMGQPRENATAKSMDWGHTHEPAAIDEYEMDTGLLIRRVGFVVHPVHPFIGCSPDAMVDPSGQAQFKCPYSPTVHIETLRSGMPAEHKAQVQGELMVTGREWSDFVSFDPRMPENCRFYRQRIRRDEAFIEYLERECVKLWGEVQDYLGVLHKRQAA